MLDFHFIFQDYDRQRTSGTGAHVIVQTPFDADAYSSEMSMDLVSDHVDVAPSETGIVPATLTGGRRKRHLANTIDSVRGGEDHEDESDQFVEATPVPVSRRRKKL
jgi:hypothetical protein